MICWFKIFLFLSLAMSIQSYQFTEQEYTAMKALSDAMPNIVETYKWNTSSYNCSDWESVDCFGVVSRFRFSNANLIGTIPTQIGFFSKLFSFDMTNNRISGTIPTQIGNLSSLVVLSFQNNSLSGTLPSQIYNLHLIDVFNFFSNNLTGTLSTQIGNLTGVKRLFLSDNNLSGTLPTQLGSLNIYDLQLAGNEFSGTIPTEIGRLDNLTQILFSDNNLEGSIPKEFGQLKNLVGLLLGDNNLNGTIPPQFSSLQNINYISFYGNPNVDSCLPPNGKCTIYDPCIRCDCADYTSCIGSCCFIPVDESIASDLVSYINVTITKTATLIFQNEFRTITLNSDGILILNSSKLSVADNFTLGEDSTISISFSETSNSITVGNCINIKGTLNITLLSEAKDNQTFDLMSYPKGCRVGEFKKLNLIQKGDCNKADLKYGPKSLVVTFQTKNCNSSPVGPPTSNSAFHLDIINFLLFICLLVHYEQIIRFNE